MVSFRARLALGLVLVLGLELVIRVSFSVNSNPNPNLTQKLTIRFQSFLGNLILEYQFSHNHSFNSFLLSFFLSFFSPITIYILLRNVRNNFSHSFVKGERKVSNVTVQLTSELIQWNLPHKIEHAA